MTDKSCQDVLGVMVDNCPVCKGKGEVKKWVAMEDGVPTGRFDGYKPCGYCSKARKVLGEIQNEGL